MPDALSKTVPIWCTIMNRLLFEDVPSAHDLYIPEGSVGDSERSQIDTRLERFLEDARVRTLNARGSPEQAD